MRRMRGVVAYTVLRLLVFVVPFLVVWALGGNVVIAAVVGAIAGVCLSVIFLPRQRADLAGAVERRATRRREDPRIVTDEDAEDAVLGDPSSSDAGRGTER